MLRPIRMHATAAIILGPLLLLGLMIGLFVGCSQPVAIEPIKKSEDIPPVAPRKFNFTPRPALPDAETARVRDLRFPQFADVAEISGIHHVYDNGASPKALMVESTGGGCGWLDYDRDEQLDLFLTQGGQPDAPTHAPRPPDSLYRQRDSGQFLDVALLAGVGDRGYGQGVAIGDFDNDGFDERWKGSGMSGRPVLPGETLIGMVTWIFTSATTPFMTPIIRFRVATRTASTRSATHGMSIQSRMSSL